MIAAAAWRSGTSAPFGSALRRGSFSASSRAIATERARASAARRLRARAAEYLVADDVVLAVRAGAGGSGAFGLATGAAGACAANSTVGKLTSAASAIGPIQENVDFFTGS